MCTLAIYFRVFPGFPLALAANRDEFLARPSSPPGFLDESGAIFGGRDERFGGTWFGVNRRGIAAALLNRRSPLPPDPTRRSRGLLCLDALRQSSSKKALAWAKSQRPDEYNPFNLLVADLGNAWVMTNHGGLFEFTNLDPGLHLLTNADVNDATCPRIAASHRLFAELVGERRGPDDASFRSRLQSILSRHDTALDPREPGGSLCLHAGEYGTRSSTVAWLDADRHWTYLHSDEPPCRGTLRPLNVFGAR